MVIMKVGLVKGISFDKGFPVCGQCFTHSRWT